MSGCKDPRYQTRREINSAADRSIEAFSDQIDLPVLELPVGADTGIAFQKIRQQRQNVFNSERHAHADLEHAGWFATIRCDARNCGLQFIKIVSDRVKEALYRPEKMSGEELRLGHIGAYQTFYCASSIARRFPYGGGRDMMEWSI